MSEEIKVQKVEIKVGGTTLSITIAEAKALRDELNLVFPAQIPFSPVTVIDRTPEYVPPIVQPWWGIGDPPYNPNDTYPRVTCSCSSGIS